MALWTRAEYLEAADGLSAVPTDDVYQAFAGAMLSWAAASRGGTRVKRVRIGPVAVSPGSVNRTLSPSSVTGTVTFPERILVPLESGQAYLWRVLAIAAAGTVLAESRMVGIRAP